MSAPRLRKASTQREFDSLLDDYITQGYEVLNRGEQSAMLRKGTWGTGAGHLLWFLLTCGLGNMVYALVAHLGADQVLLRLEADLVAAAPRPPPHRTPRSVAVPAPDPVATAISAPSRRILCPHCQRACRLPAGLTGKARCPACRGAFSVLD